MSPSRTLRRALFCLVCALIVLPLHAGEVGAGVDAELESLARRIADAHTALARSGEDLEDATRQSARVEASLRRTRDTLRQIARVMYITGGIDRDLPLIGNDPHDALERSMYVELVARADRSFIEQFVVRKKQLAALEKHLRGLRSAQSAYLGRLQEERARLDALFEKERARQRATRAPVAASAAVAVTGGSGPFQVCPVDPPRAYTNDYGDPRGCCRSHQGIDILAPRGTPVRAPFAGRAVRKSNSLGGLTVKVYGARGYVYNAHLNSFGRSGSVRAGDVVGYVGNTGNASGTSPHNHFEWHPGGGGSVNPYSYLNAVC